MNASINLWMQVRLIFATEADRVAVGGSHIRWYGIWEALHRRQRFRAILLTSATTVAGLLPLIFEISQQARTLIPLAVSIAFGIMASTVLVLIVIPCIYVIEADVASLWSKG